MRWLPSTLPKHDALPCRSPHMEAQRSVVTAGWTAIYEQSVHVAVPCGPCAPLHRYPQEPFHFQRLRLPLGLMPARLLSRCVISESEHRERPVSFGVRLCGTDVAMELKHTPISFAFSPLIQASAGWVAKEKWDCDMVSVDRESRKVRVICNLEISESAFEHPEPPILLSGFPILECLR